MIERADFLSPESPAGLEVYQLTSEVVPSCHVYMEAQVFTPDSRYFILHRSAMPHGSDSDDPEHRYLLCEVESGEMFPITSEVGATSPSISPCGRFFFYFITRSGQYSPYLGERVTLRRRRIDGSDPVDLLVLDGVIPGTRFRPSRLYPLSTISSDGQRLAISAFFGDGCSEGAPWGLWVIDLETGDSWVPLAGPSWSNMHAQFSRSRDREVCRDLMIQEDHGNISAPDGSKRGVELGTHGIDIHVIRDDGLRHRYLPWGKEPNERCQGHQCWRGESQWAIMSTLTPLGAEGGTTGQLIESQPVPFVDHLGRRSGSGVRNQLCRGEAPTYFSHFGTDRSGQRLVVDSLENLQGYMGPAGEPPRDAIHLMELGVHGEESAQEVKFLLRPRASWSQGAHPHPFLSPDGRTAFFNSDESGVMQAFMIRGLP